MVGGDTDGVSLMLATTANSECHIACAGENPVAAFMCIALQLQSTRDRCYEWQGSVLG